MNILQTRGRIRSAGAVSGRRIGGACAVALAALAVTPLAATARPEHASPRAAAAAATGTVYGGATAQRFPIVIEVSKKGRKVAGASIAIRLTCAAGGTITLRDGYAGMPVNNKRKFASAFGPETSRHDDGTTTDLEGSISGSFNKVRSKVSGNWSFKATDHDASGAVTDTCDSGTVSWTAKQ